MFAVIAERVEWMLWLAVAARLLAAGALTSIFVAIGTPTRAQDQFNVDSTPSVGPDSYNGGTAAPQQSTTGKCVGTRAQQLNAYAVTGQMPPICNVPKCVVNASAKHDYQIMIGETLPTCPTPQQTNLAQPRPTRNDLPAPLAQGLANGTCHYVNQTQIDCDLPQAAPPTARIYRGTVQEHGTPPLYQPPPGMPGHPVYFRPGVIDGNGSPPAANQLPPGVSGVRPGDQPPAAPAVHDYVKEFAGGFTLGATKCLEESIVGMAQFITMPLRASLEAAGQQMARGDVAGAVAAAGWSFSSDKVIQEAIKRAPVAGVVLLLTSEPRTTSYPTSASDWGAHIGRRFCQGILISRMVAPGKPAPRTPAVQGPPGPGGLQSVLQPRYPAPSPDYALPPVWACTC